MIKQIFIALLGAVVLFALYTVYNRAPEAIGRTIDVGGKASFRIDYANTPETRAQGLSGRVFLPEDQGMFFVFETADQHGFWMKSMNFPIDIIWIVEGVVLAIDSNLLPEGDSPSKIYYPPAPVTHVLEVNAGLAKRFGIAPGDVIRFK